jgi:hypothetical protein
MAEEGEILHNLDQSLPSVEAYKQDERREYQIAETAWRLKIPKDSLGNPTVHRYVGVLRDLEAARERLEWPEGLEPAEGSPRDDRENQARVLYMAGEMLLKDGLGTQRADLTQLKHWFDGLARRNGAEITYDNLLHPVPESPLASGPLWTGRSGSEPAPRVPWPEAASGEDGLWWDRFDLPNGQQDHEHLAQLRAEARHQGLPEDRPRNDPVARGLLGRLVDARRLVADTSDLSGLPEAPGLIPSAQQRLAGIAPLNRLAVSVLEEEFYPGRLSPSRVTGELNEVGRAHGLKIH